MLTTTKFEYKISGYSAPAAWNFLAKDLLSLHLHFVAQYKFFVIIIIIQRKFDILIHPI